MANVKISALTAASTLGGTEEIAVVQGGTTLKATPAQMATYVGHKQVLGGVIRLATAAYSRIEAHAAYYVNLFGIQFGAAAAEADISTLCSATDCEDLEQRQQGIRVILLIPWRSPRAMRLL